jgi:hypothetical protein
VAIVRTTDSVVLRCGRGADPFCSG